MQSRGSRRAGSRLGDIRVRLGSRQSRLVEVARPSIARPARPTVLYLVAGFAALIAVGTLLLLLPVATRSGDSPGLVTALFTATSAVCVTGLVVVDTNEFWSPFGQAVIMLLFQLGGLGFMTSSTLLLLMLRGRLSVRQRGLAAETMGRLGGGDIGVLVRRIVVVTLAIEAVGAALMVAIVSVTDGGFTARNAWRGIFTAVSAFNNAGFDLEGGFKSLTEFGGDPLLLGTVAVLVVLGATGFAVWADVVERRHWRTLALDTKIVLLTTALLSLLGAVVLLAVELRPGGIFDHVSPAKAVLQAVTESIYGRTAGFTVVDVGALRGELLLLFAALMFIGGASGSTAGGIKLTTFSTLFFAIVSSIKGDEHVTVFEREIPWRMVNQALAVALLSVAIAFTLVFALSLTTSGRFVDLLFEGVSAFATNGLTTGRDARPERRGAHLHGGRYVHRAAGPADAGAGAGGTGRAAGALPLSRSGSQYRMSGGRCTP